MKSWERHEQYVQQTMGLDSTASSGNKFNDPGDAVAREHYKDRAIRLYAECKSTEQKSFPLKRDLLRQYVRRAMEYGKVFCLPVRFIGEGTVEDYVLVRLEDFSYIVEDAERYADLKR